MGYLRKGTVINALRGDRETTLACYEGEREREIVRFCYDCMEREIDSLQQYEPKSLVEQQKRYDMDKVIDQLEEEKEYANADFESYVREKTPHLDSEYDDTYSQGMERALQILKEEMEGKNERRRLEQSIQ